MRRNVLCLFIAASLALAGCKADQPVAQVDAGSGGSKQGDFGPPQGEPIKACLLYTSRCV